MKKYQLEAPQVVGITIAQIIAEVAAKHGLTVVDMHSERKRSTICWARQEAYWRCINETTCSTVTIGRCFGGRDHSTIIHGAKVYAKRKAAGGPDVHPVQAEIMAVHKDLAAAAAIQEAVS